MLCNSDSLPQYLPLHSLLGLWSQGYCWALRESFIIWHQNWVLVDARISSMILEAHHKFYEESKEVFLLGLSYLSTLLCSRWDLNMRYYSNLWIILCQWLLQLMPPNSLICRESQVGPLRYTWIPLELCAWLLVDLNDGPLHLWLVWQCHIRGISFCFIVYWHNIMRSVCQTYYILFFAALTDGYFFFLCLLIYSRIPCLHNLTIRFVPWLSQSWSQ